MKVGTHIPRRLSIAGSCVICAYVNKNIIFTCFHINPMRIIFILHLNFWTVISELWKGEILLSGTQVPPAWWKNKKYLTVFKF